MSNRMLPALVIGSSNGSSNLGDSAMWEGTVDALRGLDPNRPIVTDAAPGWEPTRNGVSVVPFLYKGLRRGAPVKSRPQALLSRVRNPRPMEVARVKAAEFIGGSLKTSIAKQWYDIIQASQFLIISGAGGITDEFAIHGIYSWQAIALYAQRLGKPVAFLGQGVGPIEGARERQAAASMFSSATLVTTRDARSSEEVLSLGYEGILKSTPDWALLRAVLDDERIKATRILTALNVTTGYIAVSMHRWRAAQKHDVERVSLLFRSVAQTATQRGLAVVCVSNATSHGIGDDRVFMRELRDSAMATGAKILVVEEVITPGVARAIFGRAEALVATRYHPVVFGLAEGTPAIALHYDAYYRRKLQGALEWYGESDRTLAVQCRDSKAVTDKLTSVLGDAQREGRRRRTKELASLVVAPLEDWWRTVANGGP